MPSPKPGIRMIAIGIGAGLASGLLMVAALQPLGLWPLIFIGLVPMVIAQHQFLPRHWCWLPVSLTAFIYVLGSYSQIFLAHATWYALVAPAVVAVVVAPLAILDRTLGDRYRRAFLVIQMPIIWTGLDALRENFSLSGTGGYPVYALSYQPTLIQPISIFGISGLELLILVVNYAIALVILRLLLRNNPAGLISSRAVTVTACCTAVVAIAWTSLGFWLFNAVAQNSGRTVTVAAVQPGNFQATLGAAPTAAQLSQIQEALASKTREAAAQGAQLVVWPEESLPFPPLAGPQDAQVWFKDLLSSTGVYLVTGYVSPLPDGGYENQAGIFAPNGTQLGTYTKAHHAPFDNDEFPVGTSFPAFSTDLATIGMVICFDYDFPYTTRFATLSGANLIAAPAWQFGALARIGEEQKLILDAVAARVPAVSADLAWTSIIVQANGQVVAQALDATAAGSPALLVGDVRLGPRDAPYLMWGNWVGTMSIAGALALIVWGALVLRRRSVNPASQSAAATDPAAVAT